MIGPSASRGNFNTGSPDCQALFGLGCCPNLPSLITQILAESLPLQADSADQVRHLRNHLFSRRGRGESAQSLTLGYYQGFGFAPPRWLATIAVDHPPTCRSRPGRHDTLERPYGGPRWGDGVATAAS